MITTKKQPHSFSLSVSIIASLVCAALSQAHAYTNPAPLSPAKIAQSRALSGLERSVLSLSTDSKNRIFGQINDFDDTAILHAKSINHSTLSDNPLIKDIINEHAIYFRDIGLYAHSDSNGHNIINKGLIESIDDDIFKATAIRSELTFGDFAHVYNYGDILSKGKNNTGIGISYLALEADADKLIYNAGTIQAGLYGIDAASATNLNVINKGVIETFELNGKSVNVEINGNKKGFNVIENLGSIRSHGFGSYGIYLKNNSNALNTPHISSIINNGLITATGYGSTAIGVMQTKNYLDSLQIILGEKSKVIGGSGTGAAIDINFFGHDTVISNKGHISSLNDNAIRAIQNYNSPNANFRLYNQGVITGNLIVGSKDINVVNDKTGIFELQNIDKYGYQQIASIKLSGPKSIFRNSGKLQFSDKMKIFNFGKIEGLSEFHLEQDGIIDLTTNNAAHTDGFGHHNYGVRDTLTITGSTSQSPYQKMTFYSHGGILRLNTDLTTAGMHNINSRITDKLVIDRAQSVNGAPTWVDIVPTANSRTQAKQTAGDGFLVVEVKDKWRSDSNAFRLLHPVVASKYEYILGQKRGDWYLTSDCAPGMTCFGSNEKKLFNPATGAYLANQAAMTAMTSHSLSERLNSPLSQPRGLSNSLVSKLAASRDVAQKAQAFAMLNALAYQQQESFTSPVWVQHSNANQFSSSVFGSLDNKSKTDFMRLGGDLMASRWMSGDVNLGFMSTMGNSTADVASKATGTKSRGEVAGYTAGVYGTWLNDSKTGHGLYVDSWAQVGHFSNKVKGQTQRFGDEKYNSQIASGSIESGYTFAFNGGNKQKDGFTFTPQAQFIYHKLGTNDFTDRNGMHVRASNNDGVVSRVGFRVATGKKGFSFGEDNRVHASFESHWVRNGLNNSLDFDGENFSDNKAKDSLETKLGVQADIGKQFQFNSNVNHQFRQGDKDNYGAYSGMTYRF